MLRGESGLWVGCERLVAQACKKEPCSLRELVAVRAAPYFEQLSNN